MIQYRVQGSTEQTTTMEIIEERAGGYQILITREYDNYLKKTKEFMSSELFHSCLRTGFLTAMEPDSSLMTA